MEDVETEYHLGIDKNVYDLDKRELRLWKYDQRINLRGIPIDVKMIKSAIILVKKWEAVLINELRVTTNGYIRNVRQVARVLDWCDRQGVHLDNLQKQTVVRALEAPDLPMAVKKVLRTRQSLGKSSTAKLDAMLKAADKDDRVRDTMMYHGASTGRWTGRRIQPHNYPKSEGINQERALELIAADALKGIRPEFGDTRLTYRLNDGGGMTVVLDGDVIGEDNTATGGSDLSGMTRQQTYDAQITLTPATDLSPIVRRLGLTDPFSQHLDGLANIGAPAWVPQVGPALADESAFRGPV